jgi:hypothetical protein
MLQRFECVVYEECIRMSLQHTAIRTDPREIAALRAMRSFLIRICNSDFAAT